MADTTVIIGGFVLSEWEIPDKVNLGGEQILAEHVLIGGQRFIDAMGPKPDPISWKGRFRGPSALSRAQVLDEMRIAGAQIDLTLFDVSKTVVIKKFRYEPERFYEVPYDITVEVVTDDASSGLGALAGALDGLVSADLLSALGSAGSAPAAVQSALQPLSAAVESSSGLSDMSTADLAAFAQVARATSASIQSTVDASERSIDVLPGMVAGTDPDVMIAWLNSQETGITAESTSLDTVVYVNRIIRNVENAGS